MRSTLLRGRRSVALIALVGASTLGLVACGSDKKSSDTTVAAATETTAAAATETTAAAMATETTAAAMASETTAAAATEAKDIVDTAVGAGNFTTLAKLLTDAGLVETLKGPGPFTVFAPTDEAFAAVPADTLTALGADKAKLTKVLTYHVVSGKVMAADVKPGDVPTVEGSTIKITVTDGKVMVNDANVTATDVVASNGVIHVIDKVILPPDL